MKFFAVLVLTFHIVASKPLEEEIKVSDTVTSDKLYLSIIDIPHKEIQETITIPIATTHPPTTQACKENHESSLESKEEKEETSQYEPNKYVEDKIKKDHHCCEKSKEGRHYHNHDYTTEGDKESDESDSDSDSKSNEEEEEGVHSHKCKNNNCAEKFKERKCKCKNNNHRGHEELRKKLLN